MVLPREDINALGLSYRRIPILSIGRDIYYDTRLILQKLEEIFPDGSLGATSPSEKAVEKLLEIWMVESGIFGRAGLLIPPSMPLVRDPKFAKDRAEYMGKALTRDDVRSMRPEALAEVRDGFEFLETTLLADGRDWILKTETPRLADIEGKRGGAVTHQVSADMTLAIWLFHWLLDMEGCLPPTVISDREFPKVFDWVSRFRSALSAAKTADTKPTALDGAAALTQITGADFVKQKVRVEAGDASGLQAGQDVEVWPTDTGSRHHDRGSLVALTRQEVVFEVQTKIAGRIVRVHAPRHGFRITAVSDASKPTL